MVVYVEQRAFKKRLMRARAAAHGPRRFILDDALRDVLVRPADLRFTLEAIRRESLNTTP